ncbi:MAG: hypothetical protein KF819_27505 [Labilithrix sp.]|nr:hypothetical protein [Labilithrix sp.]
MPIDRASAAERTRHDPPTPESSEANEAPRSQRARDEHALARSIEEMPHSRDYAAFIANVASFPVAQTANVAATLHAARDLEVQKRLDDVRDRFSGPYRVDGADVPAPPMFRMNVVARSAAIQRELDTIGKRIGVQPLPSKLGQGTPRDLVKLTQALIDAGRLPPPPGDVASRIRQMQWDYGIGVDCAGYCKEALAATSPRPLPLRGPGWESFRDLDGARRAAFAKVDVTEARPGDLITLDEVPPERFGHNVIVYSRAVADAARIQALGDQHGEKMKAFLATPGPHHVLEVDSSWGAGASGSPHGGFRRDTWLFDASTKTWGHFIPGTSPPYFDTSTVGPASFDKYHGTYRPRG